MTTPKHPAAVELGRLGGRVKSDVKTRAARENAKLPRGPRRTPDMMLAALHTAVAQEARYRLALAESSRRDSVAVRGHWWMYGLLPY